MTEITICIGLFKEKRTLSRWSKNQIKQNIIVQYKQVKIFVWPVACVCVCVCTVPKNTETHTSMQTILRLQCALPTVGGGVVLLNAPPARAPVQYL